MNDSTKLPAWFMVLTGMYGVSNLLVFGLAILLNPSFGFPDMGHTAAAFPIQFFAVRHIAFAGPLLVGLIRRDVKILTVMYSIFVVMAVLDVSLLAINDYYIPVLGDPGDALKIVIGIGAFIAPTALALLHLSTYRQSASSRLPQEAS